MKIELYTANIHDTLFHVYLFYFESILFVFFFNFVQNNTDFQLNLLLLQADKVFCPLK